MADRGGSAASPSPLELGGLALRGSAPGPQAWPGQPPGLQAGQQWSQIPHLQGPPVPPSAPGSGAPPGQLPGLDAWAEKPVELSEYVGVIFRRWRAIALVTLGVLSLVVFYILTTTRIYQASSTLQVGEERKLPVLPEVEVFQSYGYVDPVLSEIEILKSRRIAQVAAKELKLEVELGRVPEGMDVRLGEFKVDPDAEGGLFYVQFLDDRGVFRVFDQDDAVVTTTRLKTPFTGPGFTLSIDDANARPGEQFTFSVQSLASAGMGLQGMTSVSTKRNTNVVDVTVRATNPRQAAGAANAIVSAYIQNTVERQAGQATKTKDFIETKIGDVEKSLKGAEEDLKKFKEKTGIVTLSEEAQRILEPWTKEESNRARIRAQKDQAQAILEILKAPQDPAKVSPITTAGIENPVLADLAQRLTGLEFRRVQMRQGYAARHSTMIALEAEIEEARKKLAQELEATLNGLVKAEQAFDSVLKGFDTDMKKLPEAEYQLASLLRQSKVNEDLYNLLLQKQAEARIAEKSQMGTAWQVDTALVNPNPVHPRKFRYLVLGVMLGLFLGVGLAFLLEHLDRSVRSVTDIERSAGLATFALIPEIVEQRGAIFSAATAATAARGSLSKGDLPTSGPSSGDLPATAPRKAKRPSRSSRKLIHHLSPRGFAPEAYRSLRTNIQFALPGLKNPCFLVTSAGPNEGKSLTCANLAIACAQMGRRVLVVDADLRRPVQHRLFELERGAGLSDVLAGKLAWREAVLPTQVPHLDIIPGGHLPPNPAELLATARMRDLVAELVAAYDLVLVDSPPVIPFTDASVLGSEVHGVFLVVRAGVTTPEAVQRARSLLEGVGARPLGAILNGVSIEQGFGLPGYYRYYYDYYYRDQDGERDLTGWRRQLSRARRTAKQWLGMRPKHPRSRSSEAEPPAEAPEDALAEGPGDVDGETGAQVDRDINGQVGGAIGVALDARSGGDAAVERRGMGGGPGGGSGRGPGAGSGGPRAEGVEEAAGVSAESRAQHGAERSSGYVAGPMAAQGAQAAVGAAGTPGEFGAPDLGDGDALDAPFNRIKAMPSVAMASMAASPAGGRATTVGPAQVEVGSGAVGSETVSSETVGSGGPGSAGALSDEPPAEADAEASVVPESVLEVIREAARKALGPEAVEQADRSSSTGGRAPAEPVRGGEPIEDESRDEKPGHEEQPGHEQQSQQPSERPSQQQLLQQEMQQQMQQRIQKQSQQPPQGQQPSPSPEEKGGRRRRRHRHRDRDTAMG